MLNKLLRKLTKKSSKLEKKLFNELRERNTIKIVSVSFTK